MSHSEFILSLNFFFFFKFNSESQSHCRTNTQSHQTDLQRDLSATMNRELGGNVQRQKNSSFGRTIFNITLCKLYLSTGRLALYASWPRIVFVPIFF